jgi:hypothetical protein
VRRRRAFGRRGRDGSSEEVASAVGRARRWWAGRGGGASDRASKDEAAVAVCAQETWQ